MRQTLKIMAVLLTVGMVCVSLSACTRTNKIESVAGTELSKASENKTQRTDNSSIGEIVQAAILKTDNTPSRSSTSTSIVKSIGRLLSLTRVMLIDQISNWKPMPLVLL